MGSACARVLASRGARVRAFDRFEPPHTLGSSHGRTRIIREAYYEHPLYVPLVRRAYELWEELERESALRLFHRTGGLMVGPPDGPLVRGAMESALRHNIPHELLDSGELSSRFPAFLADDQAVALLEHRAGVLFPERCIEAQIAGASRGGAMLHFNETVQSWATGPLGVTIRTDRDTYRADRMVVTAGAWLPALRDSIEARLPLEIERQLSHWFRPAHPDSARFAHDRVPIALWEMPDDNVFATFPDHGHGVKCGTHHAGAATSPERVNRHVSPEENATARELLEAVMPGAGGHLLESRVCLYTNTPDRHFIVDWANGGRVLVVSPCSGHGFKFASAIGEVAAQLVLDGRAWLDLEPFSLRRFQ